MIRLIWRFAILVGLAALFTWLADRPGTVTLRWLGREIETPLLAAAAALLLGLAILWIVWGFLVRLFRTPGAVGDYVRFRRHRRGYDSLSKGIIAAGAGDAAAAARHAEIAKRGLKDEPLVRLLEAQAAQLRGDRAAVKRAFEAMLNSPDTEALGLRGLHAEARQAQDWAKAREYAERALRLSPSLAWASSALLSLQSAARDWAGAEATLDAQRRAGAIDAATATKRKAVLLTARAIDAEEKSREQALDLTIKAHKLDPALVPASLIAARINSHRGRTRRALKLLRRTWALSPHPDLAEAAAHARPGDKPEARLERVRSLIAVNAGGIEGAYSLARAAAEARDWAQARKALEPWLEERPQARLCVLMAEIEEAQGDTGRAREWLARAIRAPRDPMWTIDGVTAPRWTPVSPVTGEIGLCEWKAPSDDRAEPEPEAPPAPPPAVEKPAALAEPAHAPPSPPAKTPAPPSPSLAARRILVEPAHPPDDPGLAGSFEDLDPPRLQRAPADG